MNKVFLIGRLTKDVEMKETNSGLSVANITLAVNKKDDTNFIPLVAFSTNAENLSKYAHKGSLLSVEGSLSQRSYERKDGTKSTIIEVLVDSFTLLEKKTDNTKEGE